MSVEEQIQVSLTRSEVDALIATASACINRLGEAKLLHVFEHLESARTVLVQARLDARPDDWPGFLDR